MKIKAGSVAEILSAHVKVFGLNPKGMRTAERLRLEAFTKEVNRLRSELINKSTGKAKDEE